MLTFSKTSVFLVGGKAVSFEKFLNFEVIRVIPHYQGLFVHIIFNTCF